MSGSQPNAAIWYYADADSKQRGPITAAAFRQLWDEADVDGMTLVWTPGMPSWQPVSETPALRAKLVGGDNDDDAGAAAASGSAAAHPSGVAMGAQADPSASASFSFGSRSAAPAGAGVTAGGFLYADIASGKQMGPLAPDALRAMVEAGYVANTTLVWRPGMLVWQPLSEVPELQPAGASGATVASSSADGGVGTKRSRADMEAAAAQGQSHSAAQHEGSAAAAEGNAEGSSADSHQQHPHPRGKQPQGPGGAPKRRRGLGAQQAREHPWVYVTGLPADATEAELAAHFKKAGVLALDLLTGAPKVRIYRVPEAGSGAGAGAGGAVTDGGGLSSPSASLGAGAGAGNSGQGAAAIQPANAPASDPARPPGACKGDASVCFVKEASVDLAVTLLDDVELRPGVRLRVEPASFARGDGAAGGGAGGAGGAGGGGKAKKTKRHAGQTASAAASAHLAGLSAKEQAVVRAREAEQRAALSWAEEGDESLGLRVLVLRHMFAPAELAADAAFAEELEEDVAGEALRFGEVERLSIFSRHPEGVIMVKYASAGAAADALAAFSGRFFGGRRVAAGYWDGVTDFKAEAEEHDAAGAGAGAAAHAQPSRSGGGSAGGAAGGGRGGGAGTGAGDDDEEVRLDAFGAWLESETGGGAEDAANAASTGAAVSKQPS